MIIIGNSRPNQTKAMDHDNRSHFYVIQKLNNNKFCWWTSYSITALLHHDQFHWHENEICQFVMKKEPKSKQLDQFIVTGQSRRIMMMIGNFFFICIYIECRVICEENHSPNTFHYSYNVSLSDSLFPILRILDFCCKKVRITARFDGYHLLKKWRWNPYPWSLGDWHR